MLRNTFANRRQILERNLTREIIWLLRTLMQSTEKYSKELHKQHQVSSSQLACILVLHEEGPMPLSRIARHIQVNSSTVTGIVDRLERKRVVQRVRSGSDRRVINIELTDSGRKLAENPPPLIRQTIVDAINKLPQNEIDEILLGLTKLVRLLESQGKQTGTAL